MCCHTPTVVHVCCRLEAWTPRDVGTCTGGAPFQSECPVVPSVRVYICLSNFLQAHCQSLTLICIRGKHTLYCCCHSCWSSCSPSVMCLAIGDVDTARTAAAMTGESMSASALQRDLPPVIRMQCLQHCRESINTSIGCLNHTDHLSLAMQVFERLVTCRWCCRYNKPHGQKQVQNHH